MELLQLLLPLKRPEDTKGESAQAMAVSRSPDSSEFSFRADEVNDLAVQGFSGILATPKLSHRPGKAVALPGDKLKVQEAARATAAAVKSTKQLDVDVRTAKILGMTPKQWRWAVEEKAAARLKMSMQEWRQQKKVRAEVRAEQKAAARVQTSLRQWRQQKKLWRHSFESRVAVQLDAAQPSIHRSTRSALSKSPTGLSTGKYTSRLQNAKTHIVVALEKWPSSSVPVPNAVLTVVDSRGVSICCNLGEAEWTDFTPSGRADRSFPLYTLPWTKLPLSRISDGECVVHISAGPHFRPAIERVRKVGQTYILLAGLKFEGRASWIPLEYTGKVG